MPHLDFNKIKDIQKSGSAPIKSDAGSDVTRTPKVPRQKVGPAKTNLHGALLPMYWAAVRRELKHILLTLRKWQLVEYASTILPDEEDHFIHGYDTFLEQVSQSTRKLADEHGKNVARRTASKKDKLPSYEQALRDRFWDIFAAEHNAKLKADMRILLEEDRQESTMFQNRARMLLQSAGFLDIDKCMEYRPPEHRINVWRRPAVPQLEVKDFDELNLPILGSEICSTCKQAIRGASFRNDSMVTCESCYRAHHYGRFDFAKSYKHCVLHSTITPEISEEICRCTGVSRIDPDGRVKTLFPVDKNDGHRDAGARALRCGLLNLGTLIAEAKYVGIANDAEKYKELAKVKAQSIVGRKEKKASRAFRRPDTEDKLVDDKTFAEFGESVFIDEPDDDQPYFLRPVLDKYPFGNVHMALRVGPLIIENGVQNTHGGAVITCRDPPQLQVIIDPSRDEEDSLVITEEQGQSRTLWTQKRTRTAKRYKCMMKQVVNGAFAGVFEREKEQDVIEALIGESQNEPDPGLPMAERRQLLDASLDRILDKVKAYLGPWVDKYLKSIGDQLIAEETTLLWNFRSNNCQQFCDSLIDNATFGSIFPVKKGSDPTKDGPPLYLMSFVCRPGSYEKATVFSKYDVPNGLTEEYLLKFRYGRHEESDIIDSLQEYWYDWGAFGGPIYPYQDIFPWDCTEAYGRYPIKCGECNISKHVLAYPFDSWSIITLHLSRNRHFYPPTTTAPLKSASVPDPTFQSTQDPNDATRTTMTDLSWFRNRLTLLLAHSTLLSTFAAMSRCPSFRSATSWMSASPDPKTDRLKLGGIHRAQPFSHHFERGAYHHYFVADWTHLKREQQVASYEALRDGRMRKDDVETRTNNDSSCGAGCWGLWTCGGAAVTSSCAGGCQAQCGGQCGSGTCSSGGCGGGGCGGGCGGGGC